MKRLIPIVMVAIVFFASGCVERRYYTAHHDHSERWYRHHPHRHPHVDVEIRN